MQAVILAAGKSTRTHPLTITKPKPLLKVANKTILEWNLEAVKDITKEILNKINSKIIVVSFPTATLSGRKINKKRLIWFERLIKDYSIFEIKNEIFYIIDKTNLY